MCLNSGIEVRGFRSRRCGRNQGKEKVVLILAQVI